MPISLSVKNVSKSFATKSVFADVNIEFRQECYALVGSNGVGKTVLLEILAGVLPADSGTVHLNERDACNSINYKKKMVYVPSKCSFFPSATGEEFLQFVLSVKGGDVGDLSKMISRFKLTGYMRTKFSDMSLGTQRKLFLSTLSIGANSVVILDEPTNGLDKDSCRYFYEVLARLAEKAIVIIATHDARLLEALSPTVIELNEGMMACLEEGNASVLESQGI